MSVWATRRFAALPRPGGNITGLTVVQTDLTAMKEAMPHATRIGVLWSPTAPSYRPTLEAAEAAGVRLGVQVHTVPVRSLDDKSTPIFSAKIR